MILVMEIGKIQSIQPAFSGLLFYSPIFRRQSHIIHLPQHTVSPGSFHSPERLFILSSLRGSCGIQSVHVQRVVECVPSLSTPSGKTPELASIHRARQLRAMLLSLPFPLRKAIVLAAQASPQQEICGLLLGEGLRVTAILPASNVAANPTTRFEIDPSALIAAHKAARVGGPALIGCYHSHPDGRASPSPRDAEAAEPGSVWVIVAADTLTAWQFGSEGFETLTLTMP